MDLPDCMLVVFGKVGEGLEGLADWCRTRRFEGAGVIHLDQA